MAGQTSEVPSTSDLIAELDAYATAVGATAGPWPGLTFYRFTERTEMRWDQVRTLSIGIVAPGPTTPLTTGEPWRYDTIECLAIGGHPHREQRTLEGSPEYPCLCFVLEVEPQRITKLARQLRRCDTPAPAGDSVGDSRVSTLDPELMGSVVRFLRSLSLATDRGVLTPLYLQEMAYRVLQRDHEARLISIADHQLTANPVAVAVDYITDHLAERLTVDDLAKRANLSPSAFSRAFREVTGHSPYQYVKEKRMIRAQELLVEGRLGVTDVARNVGYPSLSHFIKAFRHRYGATPGGYLDVHPTAV